MSKKEDKPVACVSCGRRVLESRMAGHQLWAKAEHELAKRPVRTEHQSWAYELLREDK